MKARRAAAKAAGTPGTVLSCPVPTDSHLIPEHCNHRDQGFLIKPAKLALQSPFCCFFFFFKNYLFYIISSVAQRRMGSSCFLDVGTMLHFTSRRTPPCRSLLCHTSVSASRGRLQLEFKALHSERDMLACHLQVNCRLLLRNPFNQSSSLHRMPPP